MQQPFFTVAIPAYKDIYLKECLDSVLAQTYTDFEIVIVNDASPFDLDSIVGSVQDPRLRYFKNEHNTGPVNVVDNWNKCLEYARGNYIICMGDDDKLMPNCLADYASLISRHPGLGVYHAWTEIIDEHSEFFDITASRCEYESVYSFIWHRWNGREKQYVGDFLYDVGVLRKNGGFYFLPLAWGSDDISAIMAAREKGIANTQSLCFCYRVNASTISTTGSIDVKMGAILQEKKWMELFLETVPENEIDRKFRACLIRQLPRWYEKKKGLTIARDIREHSIFRLFHWLLYRRKFSIGFKTLVYAVVEANKS